ncbi:MAG: hypothetical protein ACLFRH_09030 [Halothiobacillaceae bacterium]
MKRPVWLFKQQLRKGLLWLIERVASRPRLYGLARRLLHAYPALFRLVLRIYHAGGARPSVDELPENAWDEGSVTDLPRPARAFNAELEAAREDC